MFQIGMYVVCPGHGVGQINNVETKTIAEDEKQFYIIKIIANGMTVMVPTDSQDGVRELVTNMDIEEVYTLLQNHDVQVDTSTWNRRHREYLRKLKTGSLSEIADILRSLLLLKTNKKLSFGEKKMLEQCKELLVQEIAISSGNKENEVSVKIDSFFS